MKVFIVLAGLSAVLCPAFGLTYQDTSRPLCDAALAWAAGEKDTGNPSGLVWASEKFDYDTTCFVNITLTSRQVFKDKSSAGVMAVRVVTGGACEGENCRTVDKTFQGTYRRYATPDGANMEFWLGPQKNPTRTKATFISRNYEGKRFIVMFMRYQGPVLFVEHDGGIPE